MTHRKMTPWTLSSAVNANGVADRSGNDTSIVENVLENLRYYDPSTPGTLITANFNTGTYQRSVHFKSVTQSMLLRNNYQSDVKVKVYLCTPKKDTNQGPSAAWTAGIADNPATIATTALLNQYPTDFQVFNDLWKVKVAVNTTLAPGESAKASHTAKDFEYDPAVVDSHALTYQRKYKSFAWLLVVSGVPSHDSALSQIGLAQAGIDYVMNRTCIVSYDAGVNIKFVVPQNTLDTPTNGFIQSHQPVPDNIAYSAT